MERGCLPDSVVGELAAVSSSGNVPSLHVSQNRRSPDSEARHQLPDGLAVLIRLDEFIHLGARQAMLGPPRLVRAPLDGVGTRRKYLVTC